MAYTRFPLQLDSSLFVLAALFVQLTAIASTDSRSPTELLNNQQLDDITVPPRTDLFFFIDVPDETTSLDVDMFSGTGDIDLAVRFGEIPTEDDNDCFSAGFTNRERCSFDRPIAGRYFVMLTPWESGSGISLVARYETTGVNHKIEVQKLGPGSGRVFSSPARLDCGSICAAFFRDGTAVNLTAHADSQSSFSGWAGACSGTGECTVLMDQAQQVAATFSGTASTPDPVPEEVTRASSGLWFNPEQSGHGLSISVYSGDGAAIYWYTYDPEGNSLWIQGDGRIDGSRIVGRAYSYSGMKFGSWNPENRTRYDWGEFIIDFIDCNQAEMYFEGSFASESGQDSFSDTIPLVRLAGIFDQQCRL